MVRPIDEQEQEPVGQNFWQGRGCGSRAAKAVVLMIYKDIAGDTLDVLYAPDDPALHDSRVSKG